MARTQESTRERKSVMQTFRALNRQRSAHTTEVMTTNRVKGSSSVQEQSLDLSQHVESNAASKTEATQRSNAHPLPNEHEVQRTSKKRGSASLP